jgi:hypothetical protein
MALGSTHVPGIFLRVKGGLPARKADNLTAICEPTVWSMWEPRRLTTLWASTACYRDSFSWKWLAVYWQFLPHPEWATA